MYIIVYHINKIVMITYGQILQIINNKWSVKNVEIKLIMCIIAGKTFDVIIFFLRRNFRWTLYFVYYVVTVHCNILNGRDLTLQGLYSAI